METGPAPASDRPCDSNSGSEPSGEAGAREVSQLPSANQEAQRLLLFGLKDFLLALLVGTPTRKKKHPKTLAVDKKGPFSLGLEKATGSKNRRGPG